MGKGIKNVGKTAYGFIKDPYQTTKKGLANLDILKNDFGTAIEKGVSDLGTNAEKAMQDTGDFLEKGVRDLGRGIDPSQWSSDSIKGLLGTADEIASGDYKDKVDTIVDIMNPANDTTSSDITDTTDPTVPDLGEVEAPTDYSLSTEAAKRRKI